MPKFEGLPPIVSETAKRGVGEFAKRKARQAVTELAERRIESLRLYIPQPAQEEFHRSDATQVMFQGGNRAGKSLSAFVEDARACLSADPHGKYPAKDGTLVIVGYKESHIGKVIYPYLFKAGAFKIIRDAETQQWRVYRPWVPQDAARKAEAKPAPPLIPPRFIKSIAWKDKAKKVFDTVELTTGWKIMAFSSTAKPDQGFQADLMHIDEDIINVDWYNESTARIIDRGGKLRWSALPHDENDAIARFAERAESQAEQHAMGGPVPSTVVVRGSMEENPYLPKEAKEAAIAGWKSMGEDVYRKRALGELVTDSIRMYPNFRRSIHSIDQYAKDLPEAGDYCRTRQVPLNWCLRLALDPGHGTGAALLLATPPSGKFHLAFGEIYIHGCTAAVMAQQLDVSTRQKQLFQTFLIDAHGGNLTSMDTGISPREAYEREMATLDVRCEESGSRFIAGCSEIEYREETMRGMLAIRSNGVPTILYDDQTCPNLEREMTRFKKQKIGDTIIDKGNRRANTHLVECWEYLSCYVSDTTQPYIEPQQRRQSLTAGQRRVRAFKQRMADKQSKAAAMGFGTSSTIILGPTGVA